MMVQIEGGKIEMPCTVVHTNFQPQYINQQRKPYSACHRDVMLGFTILTVSTCP